MREHRWVRGDWQLLPWILGRGADAPGESDAIPAIGRWKMLDNLRRSSSAAGRPTLLARWTLDGGDPASGRRSSGDDPDPRLLAVLLGRADPARRGTPSGATCGGPARTSRSRVRRARCAIAFLAHQAWLMADAIARTLARLSSRGGGCSMGDGGAGAASAWTSTLGGFYRRMAAASSGRRAAALLVASPARGACAGRRAFLWLWALRRSWRAGRSCRRRERRRSRSRQADRDLRSIARRTWRFFETFVGPETTRLPPDNFQEDPAAGRRAPHFADQHRALPALDDRRQRPRLARDARAGRAPRGDPRTRSSGSSASAATSSTGTTRGSQAARARYVSTVDSGNLAATLASVGVPRGALEPRSFGRRAGGHRRRVGAAREAC